MAGPETANNATTGTAMIPLLALGIPSIPATAILLSALTIHGVQPGPLLLTDHPEVFWGLVASMYIGNVVLLMLNLPFVGLFVNLLRIPYGWLVPIILVISIIGVYSVNFKADRHLDHGAVGRRRLPAAQVRLRDGAAAAGARAGRPAGGEFPRWRLTMSGGSYATFADQAVADRHRTVAGAAAGSCRLGLGLRLSQGDRRRGRSGRELGVSNLDWGRQQVMSEAPLRVAVLGMGWWSDVLSDAIKRSNEIEIVACFTRSEDKRRAFAEKYGCRAAASYEEILARSLRSRPSSTRRPTTCIWRPRARRPKPASTCSSTSRSPTPCAKARPSPRSASKAGVVLALGYQRRRESHFRWIKSEIDAGRFGKLVQAECNISRDRLGQFDLSSWRYTAEGMPGGVMLQIGIHYVDVLEYPDGARSRACRRASPSSCCRATTRTSPT